MRRFEGRFSGSVTEVAEGGQEPMGQERAGREPRWRNDRRDPAWRFHDRVSGR